MPNDRGAEQLEAIGRRLKAQGRGDLRKELLRGIRESARPTIADIKASARAELPHRGGLADLVAGSSFSARTRLSGKSAGITIQGTSRSLKSLRALNAGRLRHPVYGNRNVWVEQSIAKGWFDKPIERDQDNIRQGIQSVMIDVAHKIERGI